MHDHHIPTLLLATILLTAACTDRNYSDATTDAGDTADIAVDTTTPEDASQDTAQPDSAAPDTSQPDTNVSDTTPPPDVDTPPPDTGDPELCTVERSAAMDTDALIRDPDAWLGLPVTLKGTLMPAFVGTCDDLGPCGTCYTSPSLDSALRLTGLDGAEEACGAPLRCAEAVDSCWPEWECGALTPGSMVIVRGRLRETGVTGGDESPLRRFLQAYRFEVEGAEVVRALDDELGEVEGLFVGTLQGDSRCPEAQQSPQALSMVVSTVSPFSSGVRVELMSPDVEQLPFDDTTHLGDVMPGSGCVLTNGRGGGELLLCLLAGDPLSFNGTWSAPDSDCTIQVTGARRY